jgi:hypothetical protein
MGKTPIFATLCVAMALTRGGQKFFYFPTFGYFWDTIYRQNTRIQQQRRWNCY